MARRNDPFNSRNAKWGANLISTLIAWSIVAPFAMAETLSNTQSASSNIDNKPISKTFAVILIILGIALIPLFIPLISLAFECFLALPLLIIPIIIWGVIISLVVESFTKHEEKEKIELVNNDNKDNEWLNNIISCVQDKAYNSIRSHYYEIIDNNNKIHPEIINLQKKIIHYQNALIANTLSEQKVKYCQDIIKSSLEEINKIKLKYPENQSLKPYKEPVVAISNDYQYTEYPKFKGYVYFEINKQFDNKQAININEECLLVDNGINTPKVSKKPLIPLLGRNIQILLYDTFLILSNKKDFVVIGYEDVILSYKQTVIDTCYNKMFTSLESERRNLIRHCDSTPEIRITDNKFNAILEVGLLELEIFSQKINLIFTKYEKGNRIYNIINKLRNLEETAIITQNPITAKETKEIERRRIMEEKCAKLRAKIEKDKEEEQKRKIASFQYQYSEEREEIRKRIRKELKN